MRTGSIERDTKETRIRVAVNLDGTVIAGLMAILAGVALYRVLDRLAQHSDES